jgi:hypothetical protein
VMTRLQNSCSDFGAAVKTQRGPSITVINWVKHQ